MNENFTEPKAVSHSDAFLSKLRDTTSGPHKNLENLPVSTSVLSPDVTRESYARYLKLMRDVILETENSIFPIVASVIPDLDDRRKLLAIDNDLHFLNAERKSKGKVFGKKNTGFTVAFALGILYVVEGSSLGGRFILKNINVVLGFDENLGAQYFAGYGNKTGSSWKHFLSALTDYETASDCGDEIIAGADFAFNSIYNHFSSHLRA